MSKTLVALTLVTAGIVLTAPVPAPAQTDAGTRRIDLTVYSEDFGMVHEWRSAQVTAGSSRLAVDEVSRLLDSQSVMLTWRGAAAPTVLSQRYDLGITELSEAPQQFIGKPVSVVRYGAGGQVEELQRGTLVTADGDGGAALESDGKLYVIPQGTLVAPLDASTSLLPRLTVQIRSSAPQESDFDLTYLTRGLAWTADYLLVLAPDGRTMQLQTWATVLNRTGINYPDAAVTLIAGSPNRAVQDAQSQGESVTSAQAAASPMGGGLERHRRMPEFTPAAPPVFVGSHGASSVGDFHAYTITAPTTIVREQMNRLLLLSYPDQPVDRTYSASLPDLTLIDNDYEGLWSPVLHRGTVQVELAFSNTANGGQPLPHGTVRVYERDASGVLRYTGGATLPDTPRTGKAHITLSNAFDLYTEARRVSQRRINRHSDRDQVEVVLHNDSASAVDLQVNQPMSSAWQIVSESHPHTRLDAHHAQWTVRLPAGSQRTLSYTVNLPH